MLPLRPIRLSDTMPPYLGLNYGSEEEVALEKNLDNVYTDGKFRLALPERIGLVYMPNISWTRVRPKQIHSPIRFSTKTYSLHAPDDIKIPFRPKVQEITDSTDCSWTRAAWVLPSSLITITPLST